MLQGRMWSCMAKYLMVNQVIAVMMGVMLTFITFEGDFVGATAHSPVSQLQICADTKPTPDGGQVAIFWRGANISKCSYVKSTGIKGSYDETEPHLSEDGFWLEKPNSSEKINLTVTCGKDSKAQSGMVQFQLDEGFSSNECIHADWLKKKEPISLTICLQYLNKPVTKLSWNATSPLKNCFFINESRQSNTSSPIFHVLPHSIFLNLNKTSINSRFFLQCEHPSTGDYFTSGPVNYSAAELTEKICSTKVMTIHQDTKDSSEPRISPIHQAFVSKHVGLFVTFIVASFVVIGIFALFVFRRIQREHWRQGQRLLVNEESDEAALREYQEMAT